MLDSTFIHCAGIGPKTEQRIWQAGARTWSQYLSAPDAWTLSLRMRQCIDPTVQESQERLEAGDFAWFAQNVPQREHWRAYPVFGDNIAFLDIETTGGMEASDLTVVGLYEGAEFHQFVKGRDLHLFPEAIRDKAMVVTFFGSGFDLPFLRNALGMDFPQLHIDLCFMLKRLGLSGGLKRIEDKLGIDRTEETRGLSGWDAVRLWRMHQAGNERALEMLLTYNREDVLHMENLLQWAYPRMVERTLSG
jgi:uncharacterized protein YprB with RNaseH-like and TPR domain